MNKENYRFHIGKSFFEIKELTKTEYGTLIITNGGFYTLTPSEGNNDGVAHLMKKSFKVDKKGVDIFEGDIIKTPTGVFEVFQNSEGTFVFKKGSSEKNIDEYESEDLLITGNIYEK